MLQAVQERQMVLTSGEVRQGLLCTHGVPYQSLCGYRPPAAAAAAKPPPPAAQTPVQKPSVAESPSLSDADFPSLGMGSSKAPAWKKKPEPPKREPPKPEVDEVSASNCGALPFRTAVSGRQGLEVRLECSAGVLNLREGSSSM